MVTLAMPMMAILAHTPTLNLSAIGSLLTQSDYGYIHSPIGILIVANLFIGYKMRKFFLVCYTANSRSDGRSYGTCNK